MNQQTMDAAPPAPKRAYKRRAGKKEPDSEDLSDQNWRAGDGRRESKKRKRGPGRPRKPDHELARPRRPPAAKGEQSPELQIVREWTGYIQPSNERETRQAVPPTQPVKKPPPSDRTTRHAVPQMNSAKKSAMSVVPTKDQMTIAAQQQQIEKMQETLQQYESHIKAMETRHDSTPPTPAMSIIQQFSHAHPPNLQNPYIPPGRNTNESDSPTKIDGAMQSEREDSPLSVYSDIFTPEFLSAASGVDLHQSSIPTARNSNHLDNGTRDRKGKGRVASLIITLKANPIIARTTTSKRTAQQEFESQLRTRSKGGIDQKAVHDAALAEQVALIRYRQTNPEDYAVLLARNRKSAKFLDFGHFLDDSEEELASPDNASSHLRDTHDSSMGNSANSLEGKDDPVAREAVGKGPSDFDKLMGEFAEVESMEDSGSGGCKPM